MSYTDSKSNFYEIIPEIIIDLVPKGAGRIINIKVHSNKNCSKLDLSCSRVNCYKICRLLHYDARVFLNCFRIQFYGDLLTACPDVSQVALESDAEFVILASDGLWDYVNRFNS